MLVGSGSGATARDLADHGLPFTIPHAESSPLGANLAAIAADGRAQGTAPALAAAREQGERTQDGKVLVVVQAAGSTSATATAVRQAGGTVEGQAGALVEALVPPATLDDLADDGAVAAVRPPAADAPGRDERGARGSRHSGVARARQRRERRQDRDHRLRFLRLHRAPRLGSAPRVGDARSIIAAGISAPRRRSAPSTGRRLRRSCTRWLPLPSCYLICVDSEVGLALAEQDAIADGVKDRQPLGRLVQHEPRRRDRGGWNARTRSSPTRGRTGSSG